MAQSLYREVGIDYAHNKTDAEEQDYNLDAVIKEKIGRIAQIAG
jgi:hypothetical protein